ncbi:hypothetical protein FE71_15270, partial [Staphylococcus aureus]
MYRDAGRGRHAARRRRGTAALGFRVRIDPGRFRTAPGRPCSSIEMPQYHQQAVSAAFLAGRTHAHTLEQVPGGRPNIG